MRHDCQSVAGSSVFGKSVFKMIASVFKVTNLISYTKCLVITDSNIHCIPHNTNLVGRVHLGQPQFS